MFIVYKHVNPLMPGGNKKQLLAAGLFKYM